MTLSLGVDTGGTFTDAVLIRDEETVVASAKSLTTRHDLAVGIGKAVEQVLRDANADPSDIKLASLSNALIEGQGEAVGLVLIGFAERDLEKHGLTDAMAGDPVLVIEGGHNHAGAQAAPRSTPSVVRQPSQMQMRPPSDSNTRPLTCAASALASQASRLETFSGAK